MLDEKLKSNLIETHMRMEESGQLLSPQQLEHCYSAFRSRFGPNELRQLDGERLLNTMHAHGNYDSLVYWLEFKIAGENSARFGSIAGGSALKFRIYRRKDTGVWTTGSSRKQRALDIGEAIAIARRHRDQLIAGADILSQLPSQGSDGDYANLQQALEDVAPDVCGVSWGHKYLSLLFPDKLDDYHSKEVQDFHLLKLLQRPPDGKGRYLAGGMFVRLAHELGFHLNEFTSVLNQVNGRPYKGVWRVGTDIGDDSVGSIWQHVRDQSCVAIGWPLIGDLSDMEFDKASRLKIAARLREHYSYMVPNMVSRKAGEILRFATLMEEGDPVVAASGAQILGLGRIAGPYRFDPQFHEEAPHRRIVDWQHLYAFKLPESRDGLRTTVYSLKSLDNHLDIETRLHNAPSRSRQRTPTVRRHGRLDGIPGRVQSILDRKLQVILYGPPGTGKTYWARHACRDLAALHTFGQAYEQLDANDQARVEGSASKHGLFRMCTFHPAYGYEDFIEGYRPAQGPDGSLLFKLTDGIFKQLCTDAVKDDQQHYFLLIDEINRGDIPRIFGELLTLLEVDKRGQTVLLPVSGERFTVPDNVRIIGTMNTADRSIALLDTALRRRFGFVELMPDPKVLGDAVVADSIPLGPWLAALNNRIRKHIGRDARNLQIGHSYLMQHEKPVKYFSEFVQRFREDILPLLEEYCYEDYATLTSILGETLVDESAQQIRHELFEPARRDELIQALLALAPELATSGEVVAMPQAQDEGENDEDDNGEDHGDRTGA